MAVPEEILAWADSLGDSWVRDALRRIATQSEVSEADVAELAEICKRPHGLSAAKTSSLPLVVGHLPSTRDDGPVCIAALTHVSDVNALAPNETVNFGKTGLTVIYGDNGAGKSGYSRILKRACRARGSGDPVLANALSEKPAGTPTAKVTIEVGGAETEHLWKDGTVTASDLGAVSIFDSAAAQVYVADKTEVRFRPFGLDMLDKLANVCTRVRARLDEERASLQGQRVQWPDIPTETEAGQLLANLTALTPRDDVDRIATISDAQREELAPVSDVLAVARMEDPTKKAADLTIKAGRLRRLGEELRALGVLYGASSLSRFALLRSDADAATGIAEKAAREVAGKAVLAGIETTAWREMWEASRMYSEGHAYADEPFPHVQEGARCVFCQQTLDASSRERLAKLEELVRGQAQAGARAKRKALDEASKGFASIPGERTKDAIDDLAGIDAAIAEQARRFLDESRACRAKVLASGISEPVSSSAPVEGIEKLVVGLEDRAREMERAADPAKRVVLEKCFAELQARSTVAELHPMIHAEIGRKARINAYERCVRDTDTRAATKLSGELTKKHVTDALTASFGEELKRLGFTTLELELRTAGAQKGVLYHQVQLKHSTKAQLAKIVSEGESRCIALAAFLAEVRCAAHPSTIVFDDPVSSLDNRWRKNVARRLVEEAKVRQVIVFTHELVFLSSLLQEAESREIPYLTQMLRRGGDMLAGHVDQDLPWTGLPTKKRISAIRDEWQRIAKIHREHGEKEYDPLATRLYANMRKTWERAIEEVLLDDVVVRFRPTVETQRLRRIGDITQKDLDAIEAGMTKSSKWEGGHDHALAVNEPVPLPDELKADIDALEGWVKSVRQRRS